MLSRKEANNLKKHSVCQYNNSQINGHSIAFSGGIKLC